jgi:hypothetical protein
VYAAVAARQVPKVLLVRELAGGVEDDAVRPGIVVEQLYKLRAGA